MRVGFGDSIFDSETRELVVAERPVRLPPKAFLLLELLLQRRPEAIAKDDIHRALWPDTFVADTTLTGLIRDLRAAIGDDARSPKFIRTIAAFGYAFSGDAREIRRRAPSGFFCRVIAEDGQAGLVPGENTLGRGPDSVLWIDDDTVSRRHARIRVENERAMLEDLGSRNGTFVGERRIASGAPVALRDGDRIRLGSFPIRFRASGSPSSTRSARAHSQSPRKRA
ncbi:MAG TPA: FHA domain-containing protein [Thermoanaerobaculia bacterium]|jgi:DNA-binding winged helix-turn-helix (wHTH) protein